ncbi:hypothetical protein [Hanstruepera ponticola]|uniref:hypothetical protein n=1 Tax=Hanstruepera ponticola TaxID=2042995 RepID=UPI000CF13313|nr:hypothetical protein [Hanstruepera ponticola]
MAIFGAGSNWDGNEIKEDFFKNENFVIGWDINDAEDLYSQISSIKVGDIIYLKANRPGSLEIRIKGIGIVKNSLVNQLFYKKENLLKNRRNFELPVKWIVKKEFHISIPLNTGKLTNVRAATLYEEFMPFVQSEILEKLFNEIK